MRRVFRDLIYRMSQDLIPDVSDCNRAPCHDVTNSRKKIAYRVFCDWERGNSVPEVQFSLGLDAIDVSAASACPFVMTSVQGGRGTLTHPTAMTHVPNASSPLALTTTVL